MDHEQARRRSGKGAREMIGDLLSPLHLIVLLVVALLIFGPKRLPEIGSGLGRSIKEFRDAMNNAGNSSPQDIPVKATLVPRDAEPPVDAGDGAPGPKAP